MNERDVLSRQLDVERKRFDLYAKAVGILQQELAAANFALDEAAEALLLLDEVRSLWPDIRQLQDGFMNGDPNFSEWDHSVRNRCIALSFKLEPKLFAAKQPHNRNSSPND